MRLVFMGTPAFAVPPLRVLIEDGHDIAAVYSQPPRPAGRGHKLQKSPVHLLAEDKGIKVLTPENFKAEETREELRALGAEVGVVAAYGLILPQKVLDIPAHGFVNVHGSLLPRWRGAAPIHRAILAGDEETGVTIMKMEAGLDTGPMLLKKAFPIAPDDTFETVHDRMSALGGEAIVETFRTCETLRVTPQPEEGVTYAHKIEKTEGVLHGHENAVQIDRMVRALNPWPGVWLNTPNGRVKLLQGYVRWANSDKGNFGDIIDKEGGMLCGESDGLRSVYQIGKLQTQNGKIMSVADAINGGLLACASN